KKEQTIDNAPNVGLTYSDSTELSGMFATTSSPKEGHDVPPHSRGLGMGIGIGISTLLLNTTNPLTIEWTALRQKSWDESSPHELKPQSSPPVVDVVNVSEAGSSPRRPVVNNPSWRWATVTSRETHNPNKTNHNINSHFNPNSKHESLKPALQKSTSLRESYLNRHKIKEEQRRQVMKNVKLSDFLQHEKGFRLFATHLAKEFASELNLYYKFLSLCVFPLYFTHSLPLFTTYTQKFAVCVAILSFKDANET
ncbi:hypothetical protein RFI_07282, partial [Reticulomyxa filosa]